MTAALSVERAKPHTQAAAPYQACATGVFGHCGGKDGEQGHLCSMPLDVAGTAQARKLAPDSCCYSMY